MGFPGVFWENLMPKQLHNFQINKMKEEIKALVILFKKCMKKTNNKNQIKNSQESNKMNFKKKKWKTKSINQKILHLQKKNVTFSNYEQTQKEQNY